MRLKLHPGRQLATHSKQLHSRRLACCCAWHAPQVQTDSYGEEVRGSTEYLGVTLVNETQLVGVQKSKTTISEISSDRKEAPIKVRGSGGRRSACMSSARAAVLQCCVACRSHALPRCRVPADG